MSTLEEFPEDWTRALVLMAHPDDPEYGTAIAVNKWLFAFGSVEVVPGVAAAR